MKTTLFAIAAFLLSGAVSAQKATVKTNQSATIGTGSVNGTASTQTATAADIKPDNVKTGNKGTANVSTGTNSKTATAIAAENKANISAVTANEHADALKSDINGTTNATAKSTQNVTTAVNSAIKQTTVSTTDATAKGTQHVATTANSDVKLATVDTKAAVKSVDAVAKNQTKVAVSSSIKAAGAVHNTVKVPSIKPAAHIGANMKVGLR